MSQPQAQSRYAEFYRRSLEDRDAFWAEQAQLIDWQTPPQQICDYSQPPFARWFVGGTTNLCHNAVDRHVPTRGAQAALIHVSSETGTEHTYTFAELHREVQRMAAALLSLGVQQGDRVLIYMPMLAEAAFAMLACARIGAIHSVVFGGFASGALATRIEDAEPRVIVSADAGQRGGRVTAYKPLLDEAIRLSTYKPAHVLLVDRQLAPMPLTEGCDHLYADLRAKHFDAEVPCTWVDATHTSYTLYTSGTTGKPKGVQRDTGGYAVALAASMRHIFEGNPGETFFSTSDIGWVVGHSYIVYGPLIAGMATIMYEGLPTRGMDGETNPAIWWELVEKYQVTRMFTAPTAIRGLKKFDVAHLRQHDLQSLKALYLAGEPLDQPTAQWISDGLGVPIIDNYWQTESGWPILTIANGVERAPSKFGSPGVAMYGYNVQLLNDATGELVAEAGEKGAVVIEGPLPPGCMQTIWRDDARFVKTYWQKTDEAQERWLYSTFDWGIRDVDGYYSILGRSDDVINVAGHRLGSREIEECIAGHAQVAEVAVVGVADALKGQVALAFAVARDPQLLQDAELRRRVEGEIMRRVEQQLGAVARPSRVFLVAMLPKTRSGKLLRRAMQAVAEGREVGDLSTMDDPAALQQIREVLAM